MKKFTYLVILLFSITMIGCGDIGVFTPTVENPNKNWQLELKADFFQALTTTPLGQPFTWSVDASNPNQKVLYVRNVITTDSKTEMKPYSMVINNGKAIEITYRDESPVGTTSVGSQKNTEMRHYFNILTTGSGTGSSIPVTIKYVFTNPNLGINRNEIKTLTF